MGQVMLSCKPQGRAVDGNIIVFGKPIDKTEHLGERRSALEPKFWINRCASRTVFLPGVRQRLGFRVRELAAGVDIPEYKRRRA